MNEWWIALTALEKVFICVAIPSTLLLLIQVILTLIGMGGEIDTDADTDFDGDIDGDDLDNASDFGGGFSLFSFRGVVAFFAVAGWMGYTLLKSDVPAVISVIIAVLSGFIMMAVIAILFYYLGKLQTSGTIDVRNAIGKSGTVYLTVPAKREGFGKVNVIFQGRYNEYEAVTDEEEPLKFGTEIVVIGISGLDTLVVKKK